MIQFDSTFIRPLIGRFAFAACSLLLSACQFISQPDTGSVPLIQQPPTSQEQDNLNQLFLADSPTADLADIARRYQNVVDTDTVPQIWQMGDVETFFYTEQQTETQQQTEARAVYASDQLIMWVEEGVRVRDQEILEAAEILEQLIFPTTRNLFGREPFPGIDQNPAIHILHIGDMGGSTIGYFSGKDEYPRTVAANSNQREMFYINLGFVDIGSRDYYGVVSHEFLHMVQWSTDRNEQTWINEGLAELSTMINGHGGSDFLPAYLNNPDTSLTGFNYEGGDYAAAWLMMAWLQENYGDDFIRQLVQQPENGIRGVNVLLQSYDPGVNFSEIYADWMVAVYGVAHNLNLTQSYDFESVAPYFRRTQTIQPVQPRVGHQIQTTVGQFASDYWLIPADESYTITISTTQQVSLFERDPFEGQWYWTTVPADFSEMHLTRQVDLSAVSSATLNFETVFDIESGYDYGYVAVSADNGQSWETVSTTASVNTDPHNKNLGNGITGLSGDLDRSEWVSLSADLTNWSGAGSESLLLRFTYITDDAVQHEGWALDNFSIPEIGWQDGAENGQDGWSAAGFVRHTNRLPQTFEVRTIAINQDKSAVVRAFQPDAAGIVEIDLPAAASLEETIIAITGTTPVTRQAAGYHLFVSPNDR